jgi:pimeloyl-ACP methyl ester carboxylesterase
VPKKTLLLALAIAAITPPVRSTGKALLLLSEVLPSPVKPLHVLPAPRFSTIQLADGAAELYLGRGGNKPGIVLIHGVAPGGPADPRVRQIAGALNQLGRTVLAPSLALGEQRLDMTDTARIRQAVDDLSERTDGKVLILSFSFGAAFTLVALQEEPAIQSKVLSVATVGTYFDLVHLLQGVTTGKVETAHGVADEWSPDPRAPKIVLEFLARYLNSAEARPLVDAYQNRDPSGLPPDARSIYDLMTNTDLRRTRAMVAALPGGLGKMIDALSPARRMGRIRVPILAMHSRQDPASPPSESELMVRAVRPPAEASLTLVGSFRHVTPSTGTALLKDAGPLILYGARVIGTQESWWFR